MDDSFRRQLRIRSPVLRRLGKIYFAALVIGFLLLITFHSSLNATRIGTLWFFGAVAIVLIVCSWFRERTP